MRKKSDQEKEPAAGRGCCRKRKALPCLRFAGCGGSRTLKKVQPRWRRLQRDIGQRMATIGQAPPQGKECCNCWPSNAFRPCPMAASPASSANHLLQNGFAARKLLQARESMLTTVPRLRDTRLRVGAEGLRSIIGHYLSWQGRFGTPLEVGTIYQRLGQLGPPKNGT